MNMISIHLRSSYKPDSAPAPHPHTHLHPARTTSQQCGQEATKQRCWVSSAGSVLYCLIINCNFMLNYPSHEGTSPISSALLSWSGHSMCKPEHTWCSGSLSWAHLLAKVKGCWHLGRPLQSSKQRAPVRTQLLLPPPKLLELPWPRAHEPWIQRYAVILPPPLASREAHSGHAAASAFQLSEIQNFIFQASSVISSPT